MNHISIDHRSRLRLGVVVVIVLLGAILLLAGCAPRDLPEPLRDLSDLLDSAAVRVPMVLAGLALLLAGYWLVRFMIALPGFIIGALIGAAVGTAIQGDFGLLSILGGLIVGGIGASVALLLFYLGVFLSGFGVGFFLGSALGAGISRSEDTALILGIVAGIVLGIVAIALWKMVQIVITAGMGTVLIGVAMDWTDQPLLLLVIWLVGIGVQYGLFKVIGPREEDRPTPAATPAAASTAAATTTPGPSRPEAAPTEEETATPPQEGERSGDGGGGVEAIT